VIYGISLRAKLYIYIQRCHLDWQEEWQGEIRKDKDLSFLICLTILSDSSPLFWFKLSDWTNQTFRRRQHAPKTSSNNEVAGFPSPWRHVHCQVSLSDEMRRLLLSQMPHFIPQLPALLLSSHSKSQKIAVKCENSVIGNSSLVQLNEQLEMLENCGLDYLNMVKFEKQSTEMNNSNTEQNESG
jgi:hypothetical protein